MTIEEAPHTLCAAFQRTAAVDPDAIALRTVGDSQTLTWRQYSSQVREVAAGFAALGVRRGDTVALMMANRVDFYPIDVGAQHVGATSFSIYNTLPPSAIAYVLGNAKAKVVVCEAEYVGRIRESGALLEQIVVIDAGMAPAGTLTLDQMKALGSPDFDFDAAWRSVRPDDVATLIYTSGTTGNPKGVESTHAALLFEASAVCWILPIEFGDRITSFMPSAHIADRMTALYFHMVFGTQVTVVADVRQIAAALPDCRPTIWGAVPRVWEKLKIAVERAVSNEPDDARRNALEWGLDVGARRIEMLRAGLAVPEELEHDFVKAEFTVLAPMRAELGFDKLRWAVSGAAPIPADTLAFFAGLGLQISEIWGMSELTCIASAAPADPAKLGTVGKIVPGMDMRVANDGELFVRGPLVMKGYRGEPAKTADAVDADGWLATGDVVSVDPDGYLTVIDRKKELIINSSGKNMSPATIENAIKAASSLIGGVATIGDARPYNTALISLDPEAAASFAATKEIRVDSASLATDRDMIATIAAAIATANADLSRVEQIKRFLILPTFWEPGGDELTLTMKLRRKPIAEKYALEIELLYRDPLAQGVYEPTADRTWEVPVGS
ncbi:long-subunit acyl-CoA synthetase (AMP-forming) [Rhodococcus wratislaviensis]|uniref:Acyl-CoA synthetase n=1 Tax=Rhodococcus wratislaviensis TaxID=44752 RepID=A0AB38FNU8_RHOWR|nr:fatty acid--CoA ligase FadD11 [Rhodococcus wratislaviensis]REE71507.1 long-subunit acyl-CoA synthetase (AMP-forming) [Rhodococcus wratislaviensis]SPZ43159.1 long-chain-fatty-acid--CoA ligase [Rhodococcus wratislaviensis]